MQWGYKDSQNLRKLFTQRRGQGVTLIYHQLNKRSTEIALYTATPNKKKKSVVGITIIHQYTNSFLPLDTWNSHPLKVCDVTTGYELHWLMNCGQK